jgi:hypothetical protein
MIRVMRTPPYSLHLALRRCGSSPLNLISYVDFGQRIRRGGDAKRALEFVKRVWAATANRCAALQQMIGVSALHKFLRDEFL